MFILSRFVTSKEQDETIQLSKPEVPDFWKGYYAVYKPEGVSSLWIKRYHSTMNGKTIKKAFKVLPVEDAHKIWNDYLNGLYK